MSELTMQEVFDRAAAGVIGQGGPALSDKEPICMYRGGRGRRCPVGWLITDEEFTEAMEGNNVLYLLEAGLLPDRLAPFIDMLVGLQRAHDDATLREKKGWEGQWMSKWKSLMTYVAEQHGLSPEILNR